MLTDNEIIKALEICQQTKTMGDCERSGCPAWMPEGCYYACINDSWHDALLSDALSLINRQKAEIEGLSYKVEHLEFRLDNVKEMVGEDNG